MGDEQYDIQRSAGPEPGDGEPEPGGCWAPTPRPDVGTRRDGRVLASTGHWVET